MWDKVGEDDKGAFIGEEIIATSKEMELLHKQTRFHHSTSSCRNVMVEIMDENVKKSRHVQDTLERQLDNSFNYRYHVNS